MTWASSQKWSTRSRSRRSSPRTGEHSLPAAPGLNPHSARSRVPRWPDDAIIINARISSHHHHISGVAMSSAHDTLTLLISTCCSCPYPSQYVCHRLLVRGRDGLPPFMRPLGQIRRLCGVPHTTATPRSQAPTSCPKPILHPSQVAPSV